jgi:hypothetical protein
MRTSEHLVQRGHEPCKLTLHMLRYWHKRLNQELFNGELLPCQITCGVSPPEHGSIFGVCEPLPDRRVRIHIDPRCITRSSVITTMAHEMVHQWQYQTQGYMHHGNNFRAWGARIKKELGVQI